MYSAMKATVFSILLLTSYVSALPAAEAVAEAVNEPATLEKRGNWNAVVWSGPNCNTGSSTPVSGVGGGCQHPGGQSLNLQLNGGCSFTTYSGTNCAGSSKTLSGGCNKVTFGSWLVKC